MFKKKAASENMLKNLPKTPKHKAESSKILNQIQPEVVK